MAKSVCIDSKVASRSGLIVLLRHGQTAWSLSGQHTGRTDIPLTVEGERQSVAAGKRLRTVFADRTPEYVFSSPLKRARQTALFAGLHTTQLLGDLMEWDYGPAEGRTRADIRNANGKEWNLWRQGTEGINRGLLGEWETTLPSGERVIVRNGEGETLRQVARRAQGVVDAVEPLVADGQMVVLVAHAHILRILTTCWLGLDPSAARLFRMDTAHFSTLSQYKGDNVIQVWNQ
ncbi:MAG: histidine phosphatase family protein [Bifidobacterium aquikefiri]|uniref:Histidine phosphatase n=1 Tax=Bifidobacterium aquikefiri TaxID=1653207 RepID=A0A261G0Q1_9BIFI|nr:histidine phosphatase family protein [Bifidobacterium aquikefiri]OZG64958.1 histidine phosphatase [Bifidobacterium aquikefiri]